MADIFGQPKLIPQLPASPGAFPVTAAIPFDDGATTFRGTPTQLLDARLYAPDTSPTTPRSVLDKLSDIVSVKDFGAIGDGITDDTEAFRAAFASGKTVRAPQGRYLITGPVVSTAAGQGLFGDGLNCTVLVVQGDGFNAFSFEGDTEGGGIEHLSFDGTSHFNGYLVRMYHRWRWRIGNMRFGACDGGIYIERVNDGMVDSIYCAGVRKTFIKLYGFGISGAGNEGRTDGVYFNNIRCGHNAAYQQNADAVTFDLDGNVHTVTIKTLHCGGANRGIWVRNSAGTGVSLNPAFFVVHDFQCEAPYREPCRLEAVTGFRFTVSAFYQSLTDTDLYIGSGVSEGMVVGGHMGAAGKYAVDVAGQDIDFIACDQIFNSRLSLYELPTMMIRSAARRINVVGGRIGLQQGFGLVSRYCAQIESGAQHISFSGVCFSGYIEATVLDQSGGARGNVRILGCTAYEISQDAGVRWGTKAGDGAILTPIVTDGAITGATIVNAGTGYWAAPALFVQDQAGGSGFAGTVTVAAGQVTGVTITNGGTGYTSTARMFIRPATTNPYMRPEGSASQNFTVASVGSASEVQLRNDEGIGFRVRDDALGFFGSLVTKRNVGGVTNGDLVQLQSVVRSILTAIGPDGYNLVNDLTTGG